MLAALGFQNFTSLSQKSVELPEPKKGSLRSFPVDIVEEGCFLSSLHVSGASDLLMPL